MALLTGLTQDGLEVPIQVKPDGKMVAEGLTGPAGPAGGIGVQGPAGPAGPVGPGWAVRDWGSGASVQSTVEWNGFDPSTKRITVSWAALDTTPQTGVVFELGTAAGYLQAGYYGFFAYSTFAPNTLSGQLDLSANVVIGGAEGRYRSGSVVCRNMGGGLWNLELGGWLSPPTYRVWATAVITSSAPITRARIAVDTPGGVFLGGSTHCLSEG